MCEHSSHGFARLCLDVKSIAETCPFINQFLHVLFRAREERQIIRELQSADLLAPERRRPVLELHGLQSRDEVADEQDVERGGLHAAFPRANRDVRGAGIAVWPSDSASGLAIERGKGTNEAIRRTHVGKFLPEQISVHCGERLLNVYIRDI